MINGKEYRNFIFDLYGTLTDIWTDEKRLSFWKEVYQWFFDHGAVYKSPAALKKAYFGYCTDAQAESPDPLYEIELRRVFVRLFADQGVTADPGLIEETAFYFRRASTVRLSSYDWVLPVFEKLRASGKKLYLLSNAQACFTVPELKLLQLDRAFDGIVLSSDVSVKKPSERIIRILMERYGLSAEESLMIGNDQHADVAVADAVGMDSFYIETETSGAYDPKIRAAFELREKDRAARDRKLEDFFCRLTEEKTMDEKTILVTAFEPFGGEAVNASELILNMLPDEICSVRIRKIILPVVFRKCAEKAIREAGTVQPAAIVCLGQAGGRDAITPERIAINVMDARIADNEGNRPSDVPIDPMGPAAYFSTLPIKAMAQSIRSSGIPAKVSDTAGTFVCNDLMYEMLAYVSVHRPDVPCGFIHVPYLSGQIPDGTQPAIALEDAAKGIEAALGVLALWLQKGE
ncbi:MAG: pyroglutamyl-peptidase I [Lachnospiraceae bacterium]|nr:pyroglutamyl-peptidase I [Lachnospiraceae bacterium]